MNITSIGVIGAGIMGSGIAQVAARSGFKVIMRAIGDSFVFRGLSIIKKNIDREVQKNRLTREEADCILSRLKGTTDINELSACTIIIEAAAEKMELKRIYTGSWTRYAGRRLYLPPTLPGFPYRKWLPPPEGLINS